jgi:hypothetical protein
MIAYVCHYLQVVDFVILLIGGAGDLNKAYEYDNHPLNSYLDAPLTPHNHLSTPPPSSTHQ